MNKDLREVRELLLPWLSGARMLKTEGTEAPGPEREGVCLLTCSEHIKEPLWLKWSEQVTGSRCAQRDGREERREA